MTITLAKAAINTFWKVSQITEPTIKTRLQKIGVDVGTELMVLEPYEKTLPVKMRLVGQKKDILISPCMTMQMLVHSSDDKKISLAEIPIGSEAHLESITGDSTHLAEDLEKLGITVGTTDFQILRRLPPMLYTAFNEENKKVELTEDMASKILGEMDGKTVQFSMAGKGRKFTITTLLGCEKAQKRLHSFGVHIGGKLLLDHVEPCDELQTRDSQGQIRLITKDKMQFYLPLENCEHIFVSPK